MDGRKAHEKMLNLICDSLGKCKLNYGYHIISIRMSKMKKTDDIKYW